MNTNNDRDSNAPEMTNGAVEPITLAPSAERQASVLLRLSEAITSTIELGALLDLVVQQAAELVEADRASIWLYDAKLGTLTSAAIHGVDPEFATRWRGERRHWEDEPLSRLALASGEVVIVEDASADPRTDKGAVNLFGDRSILVVPLIARGVTVGSLYLNHIREFHRYLIDELDLIRAVAGLAAQVIWNAELYDQSQRRGEELQRSFQRIGAALASTVNYDETLRVIVGAAVEFLGADAGGLAIAESPGGPLRLRAVHGAEFAQVQAIGASLGGRIELEVVSGVLPIGDGDSWSYLAVPLVGREGAFGLLGVVTRGERGFSRDETELLQTFASQGAAALEDARLYAVTLQREEEARRRADEIGRLNQIGTAINESLELEDVFAVIAASAKELVGSDIASILIIEEDMGQRLAVSVPDGYRTPVRRNGLTNHVYRTGEIAVVPDTSIDPRVNPEVIQNGVRSLICAPLRVEGKPVGVLYLNSNVPRQYSPVTLSLLEVLAQQAGVALKNARLFQAVVQEKEKMGAIVEHSSDGILLLDSRRQVVTANPAVARIAGWPIDSTIGRRCFEVLGCQGGEESTCPACPFCPFNEGPEGVGPHELIGRTTTGAELTLAVTVSRVAPSPEFGELGIAMIRDVSESRRLEEAKTNFVSLISHELRTPLSLVKGYLNTLRRADQLGLDPERRSDFLVKADQAADRLHRLIDDLLTASRLEAGRLTLQRAPVDLAELLRQEAAWCETLELGRPVVLDIPSGPATVLGDRQRLEEVIHNLVENAHKYSPPDRPVTLSLHQITSGATRLWQIAVRDEGIGLGADEARNVFEKFYRGEHAQTRAIGGIGLGLAIVKGLVTAHDGNVWVDTAPGKGSVFYVVLPAYEPYRAPIGGQ